MFKGSQAPAGKQFEAVFKLVPKNLSTLMRQPAEKPQLQHDVSIKCHHLPNRQPSLIQFDFTNIVGDQTV